MKGRKSAARSHLELRFDAATKVMRLPISLLPLVLIFVLFMSLLLWLKEEVFSLADLILESLAH